MAFAAHTFARPTSDQVSGNPAMAASKSATIPGQASTVLDTSKLVGFTFSSA